MSWNRKRSKMQTRMQNWKQKIRSDRKPNTGIYLTMWMFLMAELFVFPELLFPDCIGGKVQNEEANGRAEAKDQREKRKNGKEKGEEEHAEENTEDLAETYRFEWKLWFFH